MSQHFPLADLAIISEQGHMQVPLSLLKEFYSLMSALDVQDAQLVLEVDHDVVELINLLQTKDEQGKALLVRFIKDNTGKKVVLIDAVLLERYSANLLCKLAELANKGFTPDEAALMLDATEGHLMPNDTLSSHLSQN